MGSSLPQSTFLYHDLFSAGVLKEPRITRHGAPGHTAILAGTEYLKTVAKRFVTGQTPNNWHYTKLERDEIRLLQVQPYKSDDDPIICILFKAKRQEVSNGYEALSYSWGDIPKIYHPIWIEDRDSPGEEPYKDAMKMAAELTLLEKKRKRSLRQSRKNEIKDKLIEINNQLPSLSQQGDAEEASMVERKKKLDLELELEKLSRIDWLEANQIRIIDERERLRKSGELETKEREERLDSLKIEGKDTAVELEKLEDEVAKNMGVGVEDDIELGVMSMLLERRMLLGRRKGLERKKNTTRVNQRRAVEEFSVRPNLYTALLHLRRPDTAVNLWVDAVCINQQRDGEKEKEEQLEVMAEIYGNARNVCVWLGDSNMQLKAGLTFVERIMDFTYFDKAFKSLNSKPVLRPNMHFSENDGPHQRANNEEPPGGTDNLDDRGRTQWYNLMVLLRSRWFSRRWIIQEIGMARNASVHVGSNVIHWDDLCDAINLLNEKADELRSMTRDHDEFGDIEGLSATTLVKVIGNACMKNSQGKVTVKLLTLETLVCSLLAFDSFHAYDAIYSLLSLASDVDLESDDDPDYTIKANFKRSTRDLYISFVHRSIKTTGRLDIICRHWAPVIRNEIKEELKLPSWVSSMEKSQFGLPSDGHGRQYGENFVGFHTGDTRRRYKACGDTNAKFRIGKNSEPEAPQKVPLVQSAVPEQSGTVSHNGKMYISTGKSGPFSKDLHKSSLSLDMSPSNPFDSTPDQTEDFLGRDGYTQLPDEPDDKNAGLNPPRRNTAPESGKCHLPSRESTKTLPVQPPLEQLTKQARVKRKPPTPPKNERRAKPSPKPMIGDKKDKLSGILSAEGFQIGHIVDTSGVMNGGVEGKWVKEKFGWKNPSENDNQVPDVLWRILVADRSPDGGPAPHWYRRACLHALCDPKITDGSGYMDVSKYTTRRVLGEMTARYLRRADSVIKKRRLFAATPEVDDTPGLVGDNFPSMYGLAPESARNEDLVCILLGCSVPVILRRMSEDKYSLIGEAYVHGKMQGEAMSDRSKLEGSILTTFNII
jgi:hypothetical protein